MTVLALLAALCSALDFQTSPHAKWIPVQMGQNALRILVDHTLKTRQGIEVLDSLVILERDRLSSLYEFYDSDTLQGPFTLARFGKRGWRIPDGTMLRQGPGWGTTRPIPPFVVSGDSLCQWDTVRYQLAGDEAAWDSLCFSVTGPLRKARLVSKWTDTLRPLRTRVERDPGQYFRSWEFPKLPDRIVLLPDTEADLHRTDFHWLDDSGHRLAAEKVVPWPSDSMPCFLAQAGLLDARICPHLMPRGFRIVWLVFPGSPDTLFAHLHRRRDADPPDCSLETHLDRVTKFCPDPLDPSKLLPRWIFRLGWSDTVFLPDLEPQYEDSMDHPSWHLSPDRIPLPDGWTVESPRVRFQQTKPYDRTLDFRFNPYTLRWKHGSHLWALEPLAGYDQSIVAELPPNRQNSPEQVSSRRDFPMLWRLSPSPFDTSSFPVEGMGRAHWTGQVRWRTPDSLVAWARLSCTGKALALLGKDSLTIEIPVEWKPADSTTEFVLHPESGFRTYPGYWLPWGTGLTILSEEPFALEQTPSGKRLVVFSKDRDSSAANRLLRGHVGDIGLELRDTRKAAPFTGRSADDLYIKSVTSLDIGPDFQLGTGGPGRSPHWLWVKDNLRYEKRW